MSDPSRRTILLGEDDTVFALATRQILESAGYDVTVAHSGEKALRIVSDSFTPDLVLVDIDLGRGIDGTETAQRILENHPVPIVFLSSHTEPEIVARTEKVTSYGYIQKTTEETILLASIRNAFKLWDAHHRSAESESLHPRKADAHYLENELFELVQQDSTIFTFLREGSLDGMWYWDIEKPEHEWMDNRFWQLLGHDPETKRHDPAEWQNLIHPEDLTVALDNFHKHLADPTHPYDQVVRYTHKDGGTVYVRCRGLAIRDENGTPRRMLGVHNDITELMTTIDTEKMLRHELNHRVKNNMAIVESLISLKQSENEGNTDLSDILHQVDTIRVLHEQLQASDELTILQLKPYLRSILSSVFNSAVHVEITGPDVEVTSKVAVPLGLVVNELATNAVKHGFPGEDEKRFTVNIVEINDQADHVHITVSNTGPPFPPHVNMNTTSSLGLRLISSLIEQLDSNLVLTREPHPVFEFDVEKCGVQVRRD